MPQVGGYVTAGGLSGDILRQVGMENVEVYIGSCQRSRIIIGMVAE